MRVSVADRRAYVWLLVVCLVAYFGFHAVREDLAPGPLRDSFPSLLTPLAMFSLVEFLPAVRFRSRWIKFAVLAATSGIAAVWLEGLVPLLTNRATGDLTDAMAMGVGFLAFWMFDSVVATASAESVPNAEPCRSKVQDPAA